MMDEGDDPAQHNHREAGDYANTQQIADNKFHPADGISASSGGGSVADHGAKIPLYNICTQIQANTNTNAMRMTLPLSHGSISDPISAPINTPAATGAAMNGS